MLQLHELKYVQAYDIDELTRNQLISNDLIGLKEKNCFFLTLYEKKFHLHNQLKYSVVSNLGEAGKFIKIYFQKEKCR